jgi:hypothetical protein
VTAWAPDGSLYKILDDTAGWNRTPTTPSTSNVMLGRLDGSQRRRLRFALEVPARDRFLMVCRSVHLGFLIAQDPSL